jgi:hypothetical protein
MYLPGMDVKKTKIIIVKDGRPVCLLPEHEARILSIRNDVRYGDSTTCNMSVDCDMEQHSIGNIS